MKIEDWFDVNNLEHLKALEHLNDNGAWPVGFLPDDIEIEPLSSTMIFLRLGKEYTELLYGKSNLHINRKYNSYCEVQQWNRTTPKAKGRKKTWLEYEYKLVLSEEFTVEEKMVLLGRSKSSIMTKKWKLEKGEIK